MPFGLWHYRSHGSKQQGVEVMSSSRNATRFSKWCALLVQTTHVNQGNQFLKFR